jgi:hypothetical protein
MCVDLRYKALQGSLGQYLVKGIPAFCSGSKIPEPRDYLGIHEDEAACAIRLERKHIRMTEPTYCEARARAFKPETSSSTTVPSTPT